MKIEINTSAKNVEMANFLLSQAIKSIKDNPINATKLGISIADVDKAEAFRKSLIKSFLK